MAKFSRQHYEILANVLGMCPDNLPGCDTKLWIIEELANQLAMDNSAFQEGKFIERIDTITKERQRGNKQ